MRKASIFIVAAVILWITPGKLSEAAVAEVPREDRQVLYYSFDGEWAETVPDMSGSGRCGRLSGGVKRVAGITGVALEFDGKNYLESKNHYDSMSGLTVSFWIWQPRSQERGMYVLGNSLGAGIVGQAGFKFLKLTGDREKNFNFRVSDGKEGGIINRDVLPVEEWAHVAGVLEGGRIKLYVNGELRAEAGTVESTGESGAPFRIGRDGRDSAGCLPGTRIDELRIWDEALDDSDIRTLHFRYESVLSEYSTAIIVAGDAPEATTGAAKELKHYLGRIKGSDAAGIVTDPSAAYGIRKIWVGAHPELGRHVPDISLEFEHPEEILIAAFEDGQVVIAGRDLEIGGAQVESGTALAVYTFLQKYLEVRWLWPGELGEDIIKKETVSFDPFVYRFAPQTRQRSLWVGRYSWRLNNIDPDSLDFPDMGLLRRLKAAKSHEERRWHTLQRMGGSSFRIHGGHAFTDWWERYGEDYPEYFALQPDGFRGPYDPNAPRFVKLCVSNPGVAELWLDNAEEILRSRDDIAGVSAAPNDWASRGVCTCDECRSWDHPDGRGVMLSWNGLRAEHVALTDRYAKFWNILARGLKERFPDRRVYVGTIAYEAYSSAPIAVILEDNIAVSFVDTCPGVYGGFAFYPSEIRQQDREEWRKWAEQVEKLSWRPNYPHAASGIFGFPQIAARESAEDMKFMARHNLSAVRIDSMMGYWATQGVQYYLMSQLMWDPYADYREILDDYYRRGFGPAAAEIEQYFSLLENTHREFVEEAGGSGRLQQYEKLLSYYTPAILSDAESILEAAEEKSLDGPDIYGMRIAFIRRGFDFLSAQMSAVGAMAELRSGNRSVEIFTKADEFSKKVDDLLKNSAACFCLSYLHYINYRETVSRVKDFFGPPPGRFLPASSER